MYVRQWLARRDVYYGWVVVGVCFLASTVVFGTTYSFSVFFDAFASDFPSSRARLSLMFGVQTFVIYAGAAMAGPAVARLGARRALGAGAVLLGVGLLGTSYSGTFWTLIGSYGVVAAAGLSLVYLVAYATVPRWFARRRGFATGVATAGLGVGILVVAPLSARLIATVGWRTTYRLVAAAAFALLVAAAAVLADDPAEVDADATVEFGSETPPNPTADWRTLAAVVRRVATSRAFLGVFFGWVGVYATLYVVMGHLVVYTTDLGLGRWVGATAVGVIGGVTSAARLGIGYLSDHLGRLHVFVACSSIMSGAVLLLPAARTPAAVFAFAVVFGVGYGGNGALLSPLIADLFGPAYLNTVFGIISFAFAIAGLVAPSAAGFGYDLFGSYARVFLTTGAVGLVGAGFIYLAGRTATSLEADAVDA